MVSLTTDYPVSENFPDSFLLSAFFQMVMAIDIARREFPLCNLTFAINDQMQLETIEPFHLHLPFAAHPLMVLCMYMRMI